MNHLILALALKDSAAKSRLRNGAALNKQIHSLKRRINLNIWKNGKRSLKCFRGKRR